MTGMFPYIQKVGTKINFNGSFNKQGFFKFLTESTVAKKSSTNRVNVVENSRALKLADWDYYWLDSTNHPSKERTS